MCHLSLSLFWSYCQCQICQRWSELSRLSLVLKFCNIVKIVKKNAIVVKIIQKDKIEECLIFKKERVYWRKLALMLRKSTWWIHKKQQSRMNTSYFLLLSFTISFAGVSYCKKGSSFYDVWCFGIYHCIPESDLN